MNKVVIVRKNGNEIPRGMNNVITHKINSVKEEILVNPKLQEYVTNRIVEKKIINDFEYDYNVSEINIHYELEKFLEVQYSSKTRYTYEYQIRKFLTYCEGKKIPVLKVTPQEVDGYMNKLNHELSPRSVRNNIMSVNSFFKFMIYRYPDCFKLNPFRDRKLPKIVDTRKKDFCTIDDVRKLKQELLRINRKDIVCVIDLICKYGFRVGIFREMKIDSEGNWISESKGRDYKGKFLRSELKRINDTKMLSLTTSTISNKIQRYTQKLFNEGIISCSFSIHDLRRLYIRINLNECKNGTEILNFSRKIHKNLSTTIGYL
jgi:hypothetical protein